MGLQKICSSMLRGKPNDKYWRSLWRSIVVVVLLSYHFKDKEDVVWSKQEWKENVNAAEGTARFFQKLEGLPWRHCFYRNQQLLLLSSDVINSILMISCLAATFPLAVLQLSVSPYFQVPSALTRFLLVEIAVSSSLPSPLCTLLTPWIFFVLFLHNSGFSCSIWMRSSAVS